MVLPGFIVAGVAALRRREHGLFWLAPWLVFSALMGSSIIAAMVLMVMAGVTSTAPAMVMVSLVVAASLLAAWGYPGGDPFQGLRRDTRCSHNSDRLRQSPTPRREPAICGRGVARRSSMDPPS